MKIATRIALLHWQANPADPANLLRLIVAWITPGTREVPQIASEPPQLNRQRSATTPSAGPEITKSDQPLVADMIAENDPAVNFLAGVKQQRPATRWLFPTPTSISLGAIVIATASLGIAAWVASAPRTIACLSMNDAIKEAFFLGQDAPNTAHFIDPSSFGGWKAIRDEATGCWRLKKD